MTQEKYNDEVVSPLFRLLVLLALIISINVIDVYNQLLLQEMDRMPTAVTIPRKVEDIIPLTPEETFYKDISMHQAKWNQYFDSIDHCANNNPGNLMFHNQPNAVENGRWASFPTIEIGTRALVKQIEADIKRDDTLKEFISAYAPSFENDTSGYIQFMMDETGLKADDKIADCDLIILLKAIIKKEC